MLLQVYGQMVDSPRGTWTPYHMSHGMKRCVPSFFPLGLKGTFKHSETEYAKVWRRWCGDEVVGLEGGKGLNRSTWSMADTSEG